MAEEIVDQAGTDQITMADAREELSKSYGSIEALLWSDPKGFRNRAFRDVALFGVGAVIGCGLRLSFLSETKLHLDPNWNLLASGILLGARLLMTDQIIEVLSLSIFTGLNLMDRIDFVRNGKLTYIPRIVMTFLNTFLNTIYLQRLYVDWAEGLRCGKEGGVTRGKIIGMYSIARGIKTVANGVIAGFFGAGFVSALRETRSIPGLSIPSTLDTFSNIH